MQVSQTCNLCNKPNDQMLMLSCIHDPCINCAASAYAEQIHIKGQTKELYICEICGEETLLDNSTISQLTALASSIIKLPTKITKQNTKGVSQREAIPSRRKETQHPSNHLSNLQSSNTPQKKVIYYCKDHSEEQISYYCFSCWANICPQCAIHGSHKDHEVKLIKKAIAQVKGEYTDIVGKVSDSQTTMTKLKDGFLRLIKDTNQRHTRQKNMISRQFDTIRSNLAAKQKEMLKQLDQINKQNLNALTSFLETINSNYEEANKIKRTVEHVVKKDEVLILEDYRKISELEESILVLNKTTDSITGYQLHLNTQFLQQQNKEIVQNILKIKLNLRKEEVGSHNNITNGRATQ